MNVEEKFQGRAVIDVFVYRTSKALASLCIIGIGFFSVNKLSPMMTKVLIVIFAIWSLTVLLLLKTDEAKEVAVN
jgi:ATP/ADP translocase